MRPLVIKKTGANPWAPFVLGLTVMFTLSWLLLPRLLYSKKNQPFSFSHKTHTIKAQFDCDQCHWFRADGSFSGVPGLDECIKCHNWQDRKNKYSAREADFLSEFVTKDWGLSKSPSWLVNSRQPDNVYFPHVAHVKMAKIECEECHGDYGEKSSPPPYFLNRISGYSRNIEDNFKMDDCIACHIKKSKFENNACFVCHK